MDVILSLIALTIIVSLSIYEVFFAKPSNMQRGPVYWISVEGCIGVGKSTLLEKWRPALQAYCDRIGWQLIMVEEPLPPDMLSAIKEQHKSPHHAYFAQTMFFNLRHTAFVEAYEARDVKKGLLIISERSFMSDRIFWNVQNEERELPKGIHQTYLDLWEKWSDIYPTHPSLVLKLTTSMDTMMARVRQRNRDAESTLQTDYQRKLLKHHAMHDEYFKGCQVVERDTTGEFDKAFLKDLTSAVRRAIASDSVYLPNK